MIYFLQKKIKTKGYLLALLIIFILFALKGLLTLDPDFGWYLQTGNLIQKNGLFQTDPFSYTMPSYPIIDHEWLSNILISYIFSYVGTPGLVFVFTCLAVFSLYLQIKNKVGIVNVLLLVGAFVILPFFGVRVQVVTWFFFSLFIFILREKKKNKLLILLPLFILWINLHGGFILGLILILFYYLDRYLKTRCIKEIGIGILVVFAMVLLTGLNPYGFRLLAEMIRQTINTSLHLYINEWKPFYTIVNLPFYLYTTLVLVFLFKNWKTTSLFNVLILTFLFFSAIFSIRNYPLWVIGSISYILTHFIILEKIVKKTKRGEGRLTIFNTYIQIFLLLGILTQIALEGGGYYKSTVEQMYPVKAITFLRQNKFNGELFSVYGWGGYLIWKYPEKKVFIDGRMPTWEWKAPSLKESSNAFKEWREIFAGKTSIQETKKKYNISMALVPTETYMYLCEKPPSYFILKNSKRKERKNVFKDFLIIYQDNISTIYSLN